MASADLDATRTRIVEAHPGMIDTANPGFADWVENGFTKARTHLPYVDSYDTAMAVVRYYTSGFEDGHLSYSDHVRKDYPVFVTGWNVARKRGYYEVAAALPGWGVPLPPVGSMWVGCDGLPADEVLRVRVAPFTDRRAGEVNQDDRASALWMRRPVEHNLRECTFRTADGEALTLPVVYQAVTNEQFFDALLRSHDGSKRAKNGSELRDGVLWIRAGNFQLREASADREHLEAMLADLGKVRDVRAIVFDTRYNRGGDSGIGDRIFEAATGGLDFDRTGIESLPRYYAQWRVSEHLLQFLDETTERLESLYGAGSARVSEHSEFRNRVAAALAAGQAWVEQDAGHRVTRGDVTARGGRLRRGDARVALLTDRECVSACLDFADLVLRVPGVVHVGETTDADSVYMVGSRSRLPSGNILVMPVKVWRNRTRGNNQPLVPDVPVALDRDEPTVRRDVLRAVGL